MSRLLSIVAAITLALTLLAVSVVTVLASVWTYPLFSKGMVNSEGLSESEIRENYRILIRYNLDPRVEKLELIKLTQSAGGRQHFIEVKAVFQIILRAAIVAGGITLALGLYLSRKRRFAFIRGGAWLALIAPLLAGAFIAFDFDRTFVLFHEIVFRNDLWIFDFQTDPIINYLPSGLFMKNGLMIAAVALLLIIALLVVERKLLRSKQSR